MYKFLVDEILVVPTSLIFPSEQRYLRLSIDNWLLAIPYLNCLNSFRQSGKNNVARIYRFRDANYCRTNRKSYRTLCRRVSTLAGLPCEPIPPSEARATMCRRDDITTHGGHNQMRRKVIKKKKKCARNQCR